MSNLTHIIILIFIIISNLLSGEDHQVYFESAFTTPQEVTNACLECHEDAAQEVMQTIHWIWETKPVYQRGYADSLCLGKKNLINNFCIALESNWPRCTSCHAGYGWKDASFDFTKEENSLKCTNCHGKGSDKRINWESLGYRGDQQLKKNRY